MYNRCRYGDSLRLSNRFTALDILKIHEKKNESFCHFSFSIDYLKSFQVSQLTKRRSEIAIRACGLVWN
jgi:hypothetical protein